MCTHVGGIKIGFITTCICISLPYGVLLSLYPTLQLYSRVVPWIAPFDVSHPSTLSKSAYGIGGGEGHMTCSRGSGTSKGNALE